MRIIKPSYEILTDIDRETILKNIERAGRTCYKSESKITEESASAFVRNIIKRGHLSVIEHGNISVRFITDRGVTHELVRHRLASFSQESTRYVNYQSKGMAFILPPWVNSNLVGDHNLVNMENQIFFKYPEGSMFLNKVEKEDMEWFWIMAHADANYQYFIDHGWSPQQARSVLPSSLKTEIVTTANLREWMHILELRTSLKAHPQIREIMVPLLDELTVKLPEIFENVGV
jgi:thymidylate synthase (FAD)